MRIRILPAAFLFLFVTGTSAMAQFRQAPAGGAELAESRAQRIQVGITVQAVGGPCRGLVGYTTVPIEWPEQQLKIVEEDITPTAHVSYVSLGTAKMMEVRVPTLNSGDEARAIVTFEVQRSAIEPPSKTDQYVLPDVKKLDRSIRVFLVPSPKIESTDRKIRALAKQIGADKEKAWDKVETIYDWVREKVEYKNGPLKGALAALADGTGDCEELTSLFIAICRADNIPARTVWVEGHCYPEFYLLDDKGEGHWFPCQAAGTRAFGGIPESRPVLSKGDSFRPPYNRTVTQRYPADHLIGSGGTPRVKFIRKAVAE